MRKINKLKYFFFYLAFPLVFVWAFVFLNEEANKQEAKALDVGKNTDKSSAVDSLQTAQEQLCPVDENEDEYLFVGCNGFF
ncbi:hypothetical protein C0584_02675 [Candidatus Parcubacteria bacterium]|nr:MAG: hypothetical protein C0584_02675 [Candidatus Parcubacteria bacterium]